MLSLHDLRPFLTPDRNLISVQLCTITMVFVCWRCRKWMEKRIIGFAIGVFSSCRCRKMNFRVAYAQRHKSSYKRNGTRATTFYCCLTAFRRDCFVLFSLRMLVNLVHLNCVSLMMGSFLTMIVFRANYQNVQT